MNASDSRTLRVLTANIQAGSSTRRYSDYVTRSWSHALPLGRKRISLDNIAKLFQLSITPQQWVDNMNKVIGS